MTYLPKTHSNAEILPLQKEDFSSSLKSSCKDLVHSPISFSISSIDCIVDWAILRIKVSLMKKRMKVKWNVHHTLPWNTHPRRDMTKNLKCNLTYIRCMHCGRILCSGESCPHYAVTRESCKWQFNQRLINVFYALMK